MTGGSGRDTFVFVEGSDHITDFSAHVDLIEISSDMTRVELIALGEIIGNDVVFDFGDGNVLTLDGVTQLDILTDSFSFV